MPERANPVMLEPQHPPGIAPAGASTFNVPTEMTLVQSGDMCLITEDRHDELTSSINSTNGAMFTLTFGAFVPTILSLFALGDEMSGRALMVYAASTVALFLVSLSFGLRWFGDIRTNRRTRSRKIKVSAWTVVGVPKQAVPLAPDMAGPPPA